MYCFCTFDLVTKHLVTQSMSSACLMHYYRKILYVFIGEMKKKYSTAFSVEFRWYGQTTFSTFVIIVGFAVSINYFQSYFLMNNFLPERKIAKKSAHSYFMILRPRKTVNSKILTLFSFWCCSMHEMSQRCHNESCHITKGVKTTFEHIMQWLNLPILGYPRYD